MNSCIYEGWVRHRRRLPVEHAFRYRMFMMYLDLDELDRVFTGRWMWSATRPALAWFRRTDYFGDPALSLKDAALQEIRQRSGIALNGPVRVLTHLRYWGYSFNPISLYFCFAPQSAKSERLEAVIAEVRNTPWGERQPYVLTRHFGEQNELRRHYRFDKEMHVSPFIDMNVTYDLQLTVPQETLTVHIANETAQGSHFDATLALRRRPITGWSLASALLRYPFMTASVIAGIHWEALKLWWKGVPYVPRPVPTTAPRENRAS